MVMTPIDTLAALRTYLAAQATLTTVLTDASYIFASPGLPDHIVSSMPCKAITYIQAGGMPHGFQTPLTSVRIEMRCYGGTHIEASEVERALASVLDKHNNEAIGANCMFSASKVTEAQSIQEPETEWPCLWVTYNVIFNIVVT